MFFWIFSFSLSTLILMAGIVWLFVLERGNEKEKKIKPLYFITIVVSLSAVVMFLPIYGDIFKGEPLSWLKTFFLSIHNTIRLFVVDGDFDIIINHTEPLGEGISTAYRILSAVLFLGCPLLTASLLLSIFHEAISHFLLRAKRVNSYYIFSELSEKSLTLAGSLWKNIGKDKSEKYFLVFCEVKNDADFEMKTRAKELGGVCLEEDITSIRLRRGSKGKKNYFFISDDEDKNVNQAITVCKNEKSSEEVNAYVFATSLKSELVLNEARKEGKVRVRRISVPRALVYRVLYNEGKDLFDQARDAGGKKHISAVIVGLGQYGFEMAKSLIWVLQMYGYEFELHCFDEDIRKEHRFNFECSEVFTTARGENPIDPYSHYDLHIYAGEKYYSEPWLAHMEKTDPTFIFIDLGTDNDNLQMAFDLRTYFEGRGSKPKIQTIVENSDEVSALSSIKNYKKQAYDLSIIGDRASCYSMEVILNSDVEHAGLERHQEWKGSEEEFWSYSYNYNSSIASAIHKKLRIECGIPGADKKKEERTEEETDIIRRQEHDRWNAFMRTEGYSYAPERNDLGKKHNLLVPFDDLPEDIKMKDDD